MSATATVKATGEVLDFADASGQDVIQSYRLVNEYLKAYEDIKKQLQAAAREFVDERGTFEHDGYMLRVTSVQRMQYDKSVLRQVFDEDELDLFLEPSKSKVDKYIAEHLADLGEQSTLLRNSMVPAGRPYGLVRIERVAPL